VDQTFSFQKDWAALEAFLSLAGRVPSEKAAFLARYGAFDDQPGVDSFIGASRDMARMGAELGGPHNLRQRLAADSEYLSGIHAPDDVYGSIVWTAIQGEKLAESISSKLAGLPDLIGDARQVLAGNDGIVDKANAIARNLRQLADKVASYGPRLTASILMIQKTEIVNQANRAIGGMKADNRTFEEKAAKATEDMKGWFGADKAKKENESLQAQIAGLQTEIAKKQLLDTDLEDFFVKATRVASRLSNAAESLKALAKAFQDTSDRIRDTFLLGSQEQLKDVAWLAHALDAPKQIERWNEFRSAAQNFTQSVLVPAG
jgi:hypothetical protein